MAERKVSGQVTARWDVKALHAKAKAESREPICRECGKVIHLDEKATVGTALVFWPATPEPEFESVGKFHPECWIVHKVKAVRKVGTQLRG